MSEWYYQPIFLPPYKSALFLSKKLIFRRYRKVSYFSQNYRPPYFCQICQINTNYFSEKKNDLKQEIKKYRLISAKNIDFRWEKRILIICVKPVKGSPGKKYLKKEWVSGASNFSAGKIKYDTVGNIRSSALNTSRGINYYFQIEISLGLLFVFEKLKKGFFLFQK